MLRQGPHRTVVAADGGNMVYVFEDLGAGAGISPTKSLLVTLPETLLAKGLSKAILTVPHSSLQTHS